MDPKGDLVLARAVGGGSLWDSILRAFGILSLRRRSRKGAMVVSFLHFF